MTLRSSPEMAYRSVSGDERVPPIFPGLAKPVDERFDVKMRTQFPPALGASLGEESFALSGPGREYGGGFGDGATYGYGATYINGGGVGDGHGSGDGSSEGYGTGYGLGYGLGSGDGFGAGDGDGHGGGSGGGDL